MLVQPKRGEEELITDVTGLVGKDVYVEAESKYEARMNNLNQELGGGIRIHPVNRDTMITEDLIAMVSEGKIPLTVVDSDIAHINKTYYNDLDINTQLSFEQRSGWAVAPDHKWLGDSIDAWLNTDKPCSEQARLLKRYFELSKTNRAMVLYRRPDVSLRLTTCSRNMPTNMNGTGNFWHRRPMSRASLTPRQCRGPEHAD